MLMHYDLAKGSGGTIKTWNYGIYAPRIRGEEIVYETNNCPNGPCYELNYYNLSTGASDRVSTFGGTNRIVRPADLGSGRVAFVGGNATATGDAYVGLWGTGSCGVMARGPTVEPVANISVFASLVAGAFWLARRKQQ